MKQFIFILLLFICFAANAQKRAIHQHAISLGIATDASGIIFENRITDRSAIELYFMGLGAGYKYYISNPATKKVGIFTGIRHLINGPIEMGWTTVPLGVYYLSNSGFQFSFDASLSHPIYSVRGNELDFNKVEVLYLALGLRVGHRFGSVSKKDRSLKFLHALLFEAGGATIDYAVHYDLSMQINNSPVKIALAPGFFYRKIDDREQKLFPVNLTVMAGGDLNGEAGFTFPMGYFGEMKGYSDNNFLIFSFPYVGARYQKRSGGFVVKAGILLIQNERYLKLMQENLSNYGVEVKGKDQLLWPTFSLGYTFLGLKSKV